MLQELELRMLRLGVATHSPRHRTEQKTRSTCDLQL